MTIRTFPTLYKLADSGAVIEWDIVVRAVDDSISQPAVIVTRWGQEGGKTQETQDVVSEGKNVGKKNETSPLKQALGEAQSKWTKQQTKSRYVLTREAALAGERSELVAGGYDCMTAFGIEKKPKALKYPCAIQRKYDGHRVLAIIDDGVCTLWSRSRKPITGVPHINRALEKMYPTGHHEVDGEGYTMKLTFEEISSYLRSVEPKPGYEVIEYHIYDLHVEDVAFSERWGMLENVLHSAQFPLFLAPTYIVDNAEKMEAFKKQFIEAGYEGAMARNLDGLYVGKRSTDLLKLKMFEDDEFKVVAITHSTRSVFIENEAGQQEEKKMVYVMLECALPGKLSPPGATGTFTTTFNAPQASQQEIAANPEKYIGRIVTVKYQNYTDDKKPRIPKGLRWYEAL